MAKEKEELTIDSVISKKENDISDTLSTYIDEADKNYQKFLKLLISEVNIVNMVSSIDQKKLSEEQKNQINVIKHRFYKNFLDAFKATYDTFS